MYPSPSYGGKGSKRRAEKTTTVRDNWPLKGCANPLGNKEKTIKKPKKAKCTCDSFEHECCDVCTGWHKNIKDNV